MSFFTEILNPFLITRNQVKDKTGRWVDERQPRELMKRRYQSRVRANGSIGRHGVFAIWDRKVVLESLQIATNTNVYPRLWAREEDVGLSFAGNLFMTTTRSGGNSVTYPGILRTHGEHPFLKQTYFDADSRNSVMILKRPIYLPEGAELELGSMSNSDGEFSYHIVWREIED